MAIITQAAIANPTFCKITGTVEYTIEKTNKVDENRYLLNHQKMLYDDEFKYDGCLGGKTGFVTESLNTLVTFAQKDDKKLICIILKVNGKVLVCFFMNGKLDVEGILERKAVFDGIFHKGL